MTHEEHIDPDVINEPKKGLSYYTPDQSPPAGLPKTKQKDGKALPLLYRPLKLRGLTLNNRIVVSPMCQYSAQDGHFTDWHLVHLGGLATRGPALTIIEATAVQSNGRISPEDAGLYLDSHVPKLKQIVEYIHGQNQLVGIQLAHSGRKGSTVAPWISRKAEATEKGNGWPKNLSAPSALSYDPENNSTPNEMTLEDIEQFKKDWASATKRALEAGVDTIELHMGHGYLLHEFCSPHSNHRTDQYGGSFENRIRLPLELVHLTRDIIPSTMPLLIRLTGSDWLEHLPTPSWTIDDCTKFSIALAETGKVDLLDITSAALAPDQKIKSGPGFQTIFAQAVRQALDKAGYGLKESDTDNTHGAQIQQSGADEVNGLNGLSINGDNSVKRPVAVSSVGMITDGKQANEYLEQGRSDVIMSARQFLKDPFLVWTWARELDVDVHLPNQYRWGFGV